MGLGGGRMGPRTGAACDWHAILSRALDAWAWRKAAWARRKAARALGPTQSGANGCMMGAGCTLAGCTLASAGSFDDARAAAASEGAARPPPACRCSAAALSALRWRIQPSASSGERLHHMCLVARCCASWHADRTKNWSLGQVVRKPRRSLGCQLLTKCPTRPPACPPAPPPSAA